MKTIYKKLIEIYKDLHWQPDWNNPDDIRYMVIRDCGINWRYIAGQYWLIGGMLELGAILASAPYLSEMATKMLTQDDSTLIKIAAFIAPLFLIFNGLVLSGAAIHKGLQFSKESDKLTEPPSYKNRRKAKKESDGNQRIIS